MHHVVETAGLSRADWALKILRPSVDFPQVAERFELEYRKLDDLQLRHLVRVIDTNIGKKPQTLPLWFTMELCKGTVLAAARDLPFDLDVRVRWCQQLLEAVCALHHARVAHRDLKLSNLLLDESGRVRVADLGIAIEAYPMTLSAPPPRQLTPGGEPIGTRNYMAPELQYARPSGADWFRADQFSAGVCIYRMLNSDCLFPAAELDAPEMLPNLPRLTSVVARMVACEPGLRHNDVATALSDFNEAWTRDLAEMTPVLRRRGPLSFPKRN